MFLLAHRKHWKLLCFTSCIKSTLLTRVASCYFIFQYIEKQDFICLARLLFSRWHRVTANPASRGDSCIEPRAPRSNTSKLKLRAWQKLVTSTQSHKCYHDVTLIDLTCFVQPGASQTDKIQVLCMLLTVYNMTAECLIEKTKSVVGKALNLNGIHQVFNHMTFIKSNF